MRNWNTPNWKHKICKENRDMLRRVLEETAKTVLFEPIKWINYSKWWKISRNAIRWARRQYTLSRKILTNNSALLLKRQKMLKSQPVFYFLSMKWLISSKNLQILRRKTNNFYRLFSNKKIDNVHIVASTLKNDFYLLQIN